MAAAATARRIARYAYLGLILLFLAGVLVQAMLAGRFIFAGAEPTAHVELGWPLAHMLAPLAFLVSLFLGGGRAFWITSIVWFVSAAVQPIFAAMGTEGPNEAAALHIPNALVLFVLSLWLANRAWGMAMAKPVAAQPKPVARAPTQPPPVRR